MTKEQVRLSKFLSLILRHDPDCIGLTLDRNGWANVNDLIHCASQHGTNLSVGMIEDVVRLNDKKRFVFSDDKHQIRASQGHSLKVDLQLKPQQPPSILYHGTATRFKDSILRDGLTKQSRQHVHLSADEATAIKVGQRHGSPVVLKVKSATMHLQGFKFLLSDNGVWLVDHVPPQYLEVQSYGGSGNAT